MVEEAVKRYRVTYERDKSGWWASVRGVHGCHTQGRTVDEARRHIRGAWARKNKKTDRTSCDAEFRLA